MKHHEIPQLCSHIYALIRQELAFLHRCAHWWGTQRYVARQRHGGTAARYVCRSRVFVPFTGGGGEDDSSHFQFESIRSTIVNFSLSKILDCQTWFQFLASTAACSGSELVGLLSILCTFKLAARWSGGVPLFFNLYTYLLMFGRLKGFMV